MKVSHWGDHEAQHRRGRSFTQHVERQGAGPKGHGGDRGDKGQPTDSGSNSGFSSGGLDAPDGQTRDPFPPSLTAYIEILRSVAAHLREIAIRRGADAGQAIEETIDVGEPTTFAFGEEDRGECGGPPDATTLAVGEEDGGGPIPVEPDNGIGDGAGPPEFTTLAIGEEDGGAPVPVEPGNGIGDGAGPPPDATTLAVGEEDGGHVIVKPDAKPDPKDLATTQALGEEDGGYGWRYNH